jgi:fibronectin-binding autotransporter adhesin
MKKNFTESNALFKLYLLTIATFIFFQTKSQTQSQTFTTTGTWVAPCGVTTVTVQCWGGGAGGGYGSGQVQGGTGGDGGQYIEELNAFVQPGYTYSFTIGAGGDGGTPSGTGPGGLDGQSGGTTTFYLPVPAQTPSSLSAAGGGQTPFSGGADGGIGGGGGAEGGGGGGGGCGGGKGTAGASFPATTGGAGGAGADGGGAGGTGGNSGLNGNNGISPGGGGGGGNGYASTSTNGGKGAGGMIKLTWTPVATPTVSVSGTATICSGSNTTLTATGANTYVWTGGPSTASYNVSPSNTTTYTVTGTSNGCNNTATQIVTVNALPSIKISGIGTIPIGSSDTLTASGGASYVWTSGSIYDTTIVNPLNSTTYTVTGTNSNGCKDTASFIVIVGPTGINEVNALDLVSVYPVPNNGRMNISLGGNGYNFINIYDLLGREVFTKHLDTKATNANIEVNLGETAEGAYIMCVQSHDVVMYKRILVVH